MGFFRFRCPEYLIQTNTGLLVFRMKVPLDCRPKLEKKEIQYSLKTRCIYTARKHIASILPFLKDLFEGFRQGLLTALSKADLDKTIKEGIHQAIREPLINHRITIVTTHNAAHQAEPASVDVEDTQVSSAPTDILAQPKTVTSANPGKPLINIPGPTFSDVQRNFFREKEVSRGWREKTQEDHEAVLSLFWLSTMHIQKQLWSRSSRKALAWDRNIFSLLQDIQAVI